MRTRFDMQFFEKLFLFLFVIPIYVGLVDAFMYTVAGHTLTDMDWTWQRIALVFLFFVIRITLVTARNNAKAKAEGAIKDVN